MAEAEIQQLTAGVPAEIKVDQIGDGAVPMDINGSNTVEPQADILSVVKGGRMETVNGTGKDSVSNVQAALTQVDSANKRRPITLPLDVGTRLLCRWRDDKLHPVKIIERRKVSSSSDGYEYYVHYSEFNRRLDEWVNLSQLDIESVEAEGDEKLDDKNVTGLKTRNQKRKIDETHVEEGHEDFDAASLREHEEITKVKNISKIELGKYEMETWYFSPFPPEYSDCSKLFFCEFCLSFVKRKEQLARHMSFLVFITGCRSKRMLS
eukprot:TRINITY_DN8407_c0_g1_i1.p1 TRINITY_DN8407_c0_g1~~TRINITY_DN8407_c0_g1_i1.p1  ORF type:complete len:265 (-),score=51.56 TRINITY_DN8407_c0_g1_i1:35-829(-)